MSHWKQRKPQWAIELRDDCTLAMYSGSVILHRTRKEAKAHAENFAPANHRIVRVWVKYEEVKP